MKNITNKAQLENFIATTEFNGYTDYFFNNYELVEKMEDEGLVVIGNNEIFVNKNEALEVAGYFTLEKELVWSEEEQDVVEDEEGELVRFVSDDELAQIIEEIAKSFD